MTAIDDDRDYILDRLLRVARAFRLHDLDEPARRFEGIADGLRAGTFTSDEARAALPREGHPVWAVRVGLTDAA